MNTRREFLEGLAAATGAVVLVPVVSSCKSAKEGDSTPPAAAPEAAQKRSPTTSGGQDESANDKADDKAAKSTSDIPTSKPDGWDPIAFNKERGNAGAIPESYHASINGPDGDNKHLGKHLPYQPKLDAEKNLEGFIAIMWGDPDKGHAKHPNAAKGPKNNNEGHWYNWVKIRKAGDGEAEELKSEYPDWPGGGDDNKYAVFGGGDITADSGKNTIYLAGLPKGVGPGDTVRIWAHCLTHGEYVDFLTLA